MSFERKRTNHKKYWYFVKKIKISIIICKLMGGLTVKIITDDAVYVQKNDITYLNHTDLPIPASIFMKVFGNGIVVVDDSNRYEFEKFENTDEIEFFKGLDWIVDYNSVKDLSDDEIIEIGQSIAQKFNSMSSDERKENMEMITQCELLDFKMYSLRDILWFKNGKLKM